MIARSHIQYFMLLILLAMAAIFMVNAARTDSAIVDEIPHIVSGYNNLKNLDYRFNPEHPPLVKMISALPLLFLDLNFSKDQSYWTDVNGEWEAGKHFLYNSGNDAEKIIFLSRLGPILISLLFLTAVYFFGKEILGRWWALLPTFFLAFSPLTLAHGHYVTTDVGVALGMLLAIAAFLSDLYHPSKKSFFLAVLAFGLAQTIKFSSIFLIPYLFFIVIAFNLISGSILNSKIFWKGLGRTFLIILAGYLMVVYPIYLAATWHYPISKQIDDTTAIASGFSNQTAGNSIVYLASKPVTRPIAQYLLGTLMVFDRSIGGSDAFFPGEVSSHGWRYYFPIIYAMKEPLALLIFMFLGSVLAAWRILKKLIKYPKLWLENLDFYLKTSFTEAALAIFAIWYWTASIASPLNIGVRHILPVMPIMYMLAAVSVRKWFALQAYGIPVTFMDRALYALNDFFKKSLKTAFLFGLCLWLVISVSASAPFFLSYLNEAFDGRTSGFYYATDSNFDWGQDLKRLKNWVETNLDPGEKIAVDYFGEGKLDYYLGNQAVPWQSIKGNPREEGFGWLAVSVSILEKALSAPVGASSLSPTEEYRWLENPHNPKIKIGNTIFIYRL